MHSLGRETLVSEVQSELATYLQSGNFNAQALTNSLDYEDIAIEEWERLKRIHFCLTDDILNFVSALPARLRRIKTETQREHIRVRGEVRGRINWSRTIREWSENGFADRSSFECESPHTEYEIPENRVLKRLLWHIYRTVEKDIQPISKGWRKAAWSDEQIHRFHRLYNRNTYLSRIRDGRDIQATDRDLTAARCARLPLYADAYRLLDRYRRLMVDDFSKQAVRATLLDTLVLPTTESRLFELFCVFRLIRRISTQYPGIRLHPIEADTDALAVLESEEFRMVVYHDKTGNLDFHEPVDPGSPPRQAPYDRYHNAIIDFVNVLSDLTSDSRDPYLYSGRPDIVVEIYAKDQEDEVLKHVLLGEVKYTSSRQTFEQGLKELVQYRTFADRNGYLSESDDCHVTSLLITNGVPTAGSSPDIFHLQGTDLLSRENDKLTSENG